MESELERFGHFGVEFLGFGYPTDDWQQGFFPGPHSLGEYRN